MTVERKAPVLRKEVVEVPSLGEVVVRMLRLSERLSLGRAVTEVREGVRSEDFFIPRLLAATVADQAGKPVYTVDEWDIFAAEHPDDASLLSDAALRLGGFGGTAAKND